MSARKPDRCRVCHEDNVAAIVQTAGGFSRVCADHVAAIPKPLKVTMLGEPERAPRWQTAQNRTDLGNVLDDALRFAAEREAVAS